MKISKYRAKHKMTLRELAAKFGISQAHLCQLESGKRTANPDLAVRIEQATGGDISFLDVYFQLPIKRR